MGVFYESLPPCLSEWIATQKCLWVGTAPLSGSGHINISPKGGSCGEYFGVIDEKTFWYMDLSGSGCETISHLHEPGNGRITIMFNAFDGPPKIVRLWGKGRVLENGTQAFSEFISKHNVTTIPGTRSIILVDIHQVGSSCGFSVPYYDFKEFRPILNDFFEQKQKKFDKGNEKESMDRYWAYKSAWSIDGLPAMKRGLAAAKREGVEPLKKMVGPLAPRNGQYYSGGITLQQVIVVAIFSFVLGVLLASHISTLIDNLHIMAPTDSKGIIRHALSLKR